MKFITKPKLFFKPLTYLDRIIMPSQIIMKFKYCLKEYWEFYASKNLTFENCFSLWKCCFVISFQTLKVYKWENISIRSEVRGTYYKYLSQCSIYSFIYSFSKFLWSVCIRHWAGFWLCSTRGHRQGLSAFMVPSSKRRETRSIAMS